MKKLLLILSIFILTSCQQEKVKFKYVTNIESRTESKQVTVYTNDDNRVSRTAGGAVIGGIGAHLLGFKASHGAILGGLTGLASSSSGNTESYVETRLTTYYTIHFSDSSVAERINYCPWQVGDSLNINYN